MKKVYLDITTEYIKSKTSSNSLSESYRPPDLTISEDIDSSSTLVSSLMCKHLRDHEKNFEKSRETYVKTINANTKKLAQAQQRNAELRSQLDLLINPKSSCSKSHKPTPASTPKSSSLLHHQSELQQLEDKIRHQRESFLSQISLHRSEIDSLHHLLPPNLPPKQLPNLHISL